MRKHSVLLFGVGINDADYPVSVKGDAWRCPYYTRWVELLRRCYSVKYQAKQPTYTECFVCTDWLTFSKFKTWMEQQDWKGKQLDKDIILQGNKEYSPETTCFISVPLNNLLKGRSKSTTLPKGVTKHGKRFRARIQTEDGAVSLGTYATPMQASDKYIAAKYTAIRKAADSTNDPKVKQGLLRYIL